MNSFLTIHPEASLIATESAIFDTVRRVNVEALDLLSRRDEINRRIRSLHQLMHGLRGLSVKTPPLEHATPQVTQLLPPARAVPSIVGLSRACRIALLEVEGSASADEILSRIVRRGSFSFCDSKCPETEIIQALTLMAEKREIVRTNNGSEIAWQRITPANASDLSL